jgi:U3 small nucleolar RNA-associated protein 3
VCYAPSENSLSNSLEGGEGTLDNISSGMLHLYYRKQLSYYTYKSQFDLFSTEALLQYATTLAFYLYLRASEKYAQRPDLLRSHPIMSRLLTFKQSISTLEDLGVGDDEGDEDEDVSELDGEDDELGLGKKIRGITAEELQTLLADMEQLSAASRPSADEPSLGAEHAKQKKPKAMAPVAAPPPKKKRKTASGADPSGVSTLPVFDLEEPEFPARTKRTASRTGEDAGGDAFGELSALQSADAQDKAARKKSLRFHTAKIESASARRDRARTNAGGDDDIPWKERKKEKELRNKKELEKIRGMGGADLDDEEPEPRQESGKKRRRDEEEGSGSEGEGAEGYYDLVKRKSKEKKEQKKAEYEAALAMAK